MPLIFIQESPHSPLPLHTDGIGATIPVGRNVDIDERLIPILETADGVKWRYVGRPPQEADVSVPSFDPDAVIAGNVEDVAARLAALTPEQLLSVREAENDREVSRKGVLAAINKAIEGRN